MRALVTGAGGFLGYAIAEQLVARGDAVRGFSRGDHPKLEALGVERHCGDLADAEAVSRAVEGCDRVFHVAAKAGAWGPYREYHDTNVLGTANVIAACRKHGARDLIYTSTPSVVSRGGDLEGVDESLPYSESYNAHYPATKAEAERLVRAANDSMLRTVSLRPHLIWGVGDNHLLPRLVQRSRAGRLRRIGGGGKLVDTTYVDDAAAVHLLAADKLAGDDASSVAGKVYFISSGTPIETWTMINRLLAAAGEPPVTRGISRGAAYTVARMLEFAFTALRIRSEPPLTRWVVDELASAHWFDIGAARRDLGYQPQVGLDEGLRRLERWWCEVSPG